MSLLIPILLLGLLASVSPTTIVVFILLLATVHARVNAAAFLVGWSVSLVTVFAASYVIGGASTVERGTGRTAVSVLEILLGAGLAGVAARQWRRRNRPRASSGIGRKLTARLKQLRPWEAATVGVLEQPWTLTAAAAVLVARHHSGTGIAVIAFLGFTLLSTATVGLIFLYYARRPGVAEARLAEVQRRLAQAGPAIFAVVSAVAGVYLVFDGFRGVLGG